jgi:4-diphosphocytidyl-2-C-methyl-D-erythritol kinase
MRLQEVVLESYAKVNLSLDVGEKRLEDGYHYVNMVMVPISLADRVSLCLADSLEVTVSPEIPCPPEANLAYRAAMRLKEVTGYAGGAAIHIDKSIPVAGGLAGGSTNAAAVLTGLNRLWGTGLTEAELIDLAIGLGSDIPFFIPCKPARVEGIGERLTPLRVARRLWMVLVTPDVAKSTGNVYRLFDELEHVNRPDVAAMELALAEGSLERIAEALGNVFEQVMLPRHPEIEAAKSALLRAGAVGVLMSGAGPTVFGLVEDEESGRHVLEQVRELFPRAFLVHTVNENAAS